MSSPIFINILSDHGQNSLETLKLLGLLASNLSNYQIISENHCYKTGEIVPPALYVKLNLNYFPERTIHICDFKIKSTLPERYLLGFSQNQYFIGPDSGIFALMLNYNETRYYDITAAGEITDFSSQVCIPALKRLTDSAFSPDSAFVSTEKIVDAQWLQPVQLQNVYRLSVIYNDARGNAYLNMTKDEFNALGKGRKFRIRVDLRTEINQISSHYNKVPEGHLLALFGEGDLLQVALNWGSARQLLGLKENHKMLMLEFLEG